MRDVAIDASHRPNDSRPEGWESAYLRFETRAAEQEKFLGRLRAAGADEWDRDFLVLDLFSGRGGCVRALRRMGFRRVISLDLSTNLLTARDDVSDCSVADCRQLPIADQSADVATIHGGLHHLERLPADLERTLQEVARVLRPDGILVAVEPWRTPFLDAVHWACRSRVLRKASAKLDALATMIELERTTYEAWLACDQEILAAFDRYFVARRRRIRWGKLHYVGSPRFG